MKKNNYLIKRIEIKNKKKIKIKNKNSNNKKTFKKCISRQNFQTIGKRKWRRPHIIRKAIRS